MPTHFEVKRQKPHFELPRVYRFCDFQIDVAEEVLLHNAEKVSLNRRTFNVLRLLVERAGQIVTKQDFFDTIWGDTFVGDNSLTVAMTTLRKVLGDDAKNPTFIENLPRKGYRFIADVTVVEKADGPEPPTFENVTEYIAENSTSSVLRRRKLLAGLLGLGLVLASAVLGFIYVRSTASVAGANLDLSQIDSIAVMPFENQDAETEFLSDGLTDSIISNLTGISNLRVISRNSVFSYKGKSPNLETIARELNVRSVLTGRVVQSGDSFIVSVELTDLRDNRQIWGQRYDRQLANAYSVQQDISLSIAQALRTMLPNEERQRVMTRQTDDPDAYRLYIRGRYYLNKRTGEGYEKAVALFTQAIEKDPTYALAYIGQATCYAMGGFKYLPSSPLRTSFITASVKKALEIDENLAEAYGVLGLNKAYYEWDWAGAERDYRRAIELDPNYASAHHWYAELLAIHGRFDESIAEYEVARKIDPQSLAIASDLGMTFHYSGQTERAIVFLQGLKNINVDYARTYSYLGEIYASKDMLSESLQEFGTYNALTDGTITPEKSKAVLTNAFKRSGPNGYLRKLIEIGEREPGGNWIDRASYHLKLGEREKAYELLEKYTEGRAAPVVYINVRPEFETLRSEPRFVDLIRRIGLRPVN
ncbi:hypothetical protein BH10ACI2_BH10ACI2_02620 [soil metagenome]